MWYDTIRVHNRCWKLAHELLLIMFRMIEDSGGRLTFCNCYDEKYLNTVLEEAETNKAVFFRALGGNPTIPAGESALARPVQAAYNGKFTPDAKKPCMLYNLGKKEHVGDCITLALSHLVTIHSKNLHIDVTEREYLYYLIKRYQKIHLIGWILCYKWQLKYIIKI